MDNINLMDAQKGDFQNVKEGKAESWILSNVFSHFEKRRIGDSDDFSETHSIRVRFWKKVCDSETRFYRVTGSATLARLESKELDVSDLVEVQFSPDGKEVVEMVKFGHLYYDDELRKMGLWESPEGKKEV